MLEKISWTRTRVLCVPQSNLNSLYCLRFISKFLNIENDWPTKDCFHQAQRICNDTRVPDFVTKIWKKFNCLVFWKYGFLMVIKLNILFQIDCWTPINRVKNKNGQESTRYRYRSGHDVLVRGRVPARESGNHRQRPGKQDDAVLRGLHRHGASHRRRRQEPGGHESGEHRIW